MHFANDSLGYIFLALEGLIDSSASGTATPNKNFSYYIGTDLLFKAVSLPDHSAAPYNAAFTASGNKTLVIHIDADFGVLTRNIQMQSAGNTQTTDYPKLADSLAVNIPSMFRYAQ